MDTNKYFHRYKVNAFNLETMTIRKMSFATRHTDEAKIFEGIAKQLIKRKAPHIVPLSISRFKPV